MQLIDGKKISLEIQEEIAKEVSALKAAGKKVYKTQIINDRGIHICKSMVAYQKFGHDETPGSLSH